MKVVYIPDVGETYGAATSFKELVLTMKENYNVVPIVLTSKKARMYEEFKKSGIEVYSIGHKAFLISKGSTFIRKIIKTFLFPFFYVDYKLSNYFAVKKIEKTVDFSKVDLIHTNVNRNDIGAILAKRHSISHVWHIREFGDEDYDCYSLRKKYIDFMNANASLFIAISKAVSKKWIKKGLNANKVRVIYNGVDTNRFHIKAYKNNKLEDQETINIIMSGAITPSKGQIQAIKALSLIPQDIRKKIKLDLYGTAAKEYSDYLKGYIMKLGLENTVAFKGYQSNIEREIPKYDIGLVCSKAEGFGRVTIEYMLSDVCVIASDTGANPELIKNGENGLLYQLNNHKDLANKIIELIGNEELIKKIRKNGQLFAKEGFSKEKNAYNIYKEYERIKKEDKNEKDKHQ